MDCIAANVVITGASRAFDHEYTYLIPERLKDKVSVGSRIVIPFGRSNKAAEGFVFGICGDMAAADKKHSLKHIKDVPDNAPVLDSDMISLCRWMKERYICTYSDAVRTMLPPGTGMRSIRKAKIITGSPDGNPGTTVNCRRIIDFLRENGNECEIDRIKAELQLKNAAAAFRKLKETGLIEISETYTTGIREKTARTACLAIQAEEVAEALEQGRLKNIKHIKILELLLENGPASVQDIVRMAGISSGILDTLVKYGYIYFYDAEVIRDPVRYAPREDTQHLHLTGQQQHIMDSLHDSVTAGGFSEALIHGVTGSGKTEIYLRLIKHVTDMGKQAIVLVPEIALTPQMTDRFRSRFGERVAVIHSRMSIGERYDQWRLAREGRMIAAVGARSAIFAPFSNLGMVIIDEEHETSYKSEITPKYHAAEIARQRCKAAGAMLIYGSATPSVETYSRALSGDIRLFTMDKRPEGISMPDVSLVDMRKELESGNRSMFSRALTEGIEKNLQEGRQTILFLNRRGHSTFVLCRSCGHAIKCDSCNISMTYHSSGDRLICHYCGYTVKNPKTCPECGSRQIRHFGTGTQRVEEELKVQFPGCPVIRMDMDTTTGKYSHEDLLNDFRDQKAGILLGTQMVAKGHDFPNVTLVGVLAADSLLNVGDYRAAERTFQLITQVSGRAGRSTNAGKVIIQTYNTEAYSINAAVDNDYEGFYNKEILIRKELIYPPFTSISTVTISGANDKAAYDETSKWMKYLTETATEGINENADTDISGISGPVNAKILVIGPSRAPVSKMKDLYRWRIVLKTPTAERAAQLLSVMTDEFYRKNGANAGRGASQKTFLTIDINPASLI